MCGSICSIFQQNRGTRYLSEGLKTFGPAFFRAPDPACGEAWMNLTLYRRSGEEPISNPLWVAAPSRLVAPPTDLPPPDHLRRRPLFPSPLPASSANQPEPDRFHGLGVRR